MVRAVWAERGERCTLSSMTERIYSTDAYAADMTAQVVGIDQDDGRLLLDRTVFYPGGGGQPPDSGELSVRIGWW